MFRRKFKGPVASAAKQIVKNDSTSTQEPQTSSTVAPSTSQENVVEKEFQNQIISEVTQTESQSNQNEVITRPPPSSSPVKPILVDKNKKRTFSGLRSPVRFADDIDLAPSPPVNDTHRARTVSISTISSSRPTSPSPPKKRVKKVFAKDEELNLSTFTMADLIDFKPKVENNLRKKWKELENKFKEEGFTMKKEKVETTEQEICPRVKLDADGNVVIDEESLIVRRDPEAEVYEAVDDDLLPKKINSLSFRKNYSRASTWSELETELFYEILSATGTDFSLMNEYLPFKSRQDIKKKFRKEEKINLARVNSTLRNPSMLNDGMLKDRVNNLMKQIENDRAMKEALKEKKSKGRSRKNTISSTITVNTENSVCTNVASVS